MPAKEGDCSSRSVAENAQADVKQAKKDKKAAEKKLKEEQKAAKAAAKKAKKTGQPIPTEPEPAPAPEPEPMTQNISPAADGTMDGRESAASLRRLHTEWMNQRPASSPARGIDPSSATERLSVDEWCRIAKRCGLHFDDRFRHGLEGIARRNEYNTVSYDAIAEWYSTYMKRTMLPVGDDASSTGDDGTQGCGRPPPCLV